MKIFTFDNQPLSSQILINSIKKVESNAEIFSFSSSKELINQAHQTICDVAFIDIDENPFENISLAESLKKINSRVNIIFISNHTEYKAHAMDLRASGFITKPVFTNKIREEFDNLRYPIISTQKNVLIKATCFGNFDVFSKSGTPIHFERAKSKEALAYLIHLKGSSCSVAELSTILFENDNFSDQGLDYTRRIISSLKNSLTRVDAEKIIIRQHNSIAINTNMIECDYYDFLKGDEQSLKNYTGDYMFQYSWAEPTSAWIQNKLLK